MEVQLIDGLKVYNNEIQAHKNVKMHQAEWSSICLFQNVSAAEMKIEEVPVWFYLVGVSVTYCSWTTPL